MKLISLLLLTFIPMGVSAQYVMVPFTHVGGGATVTSICSQSFGSSCTLSVGAATGGCVVVALGTEDTTVPSFTVSDTKSNTYSLAVQAASASGISTNLYYSAVSVSLTTGNTVSLSASATYTVYYVTPCIGLDSGVTATSGANTTSFSVGPTSSVSVADSCMAMIGVYNAGATTFTQGAGYTALATLYNTDNRTFFSEWKTVSSGTATATATAATSGGQTNYPAVLGCFKI